MKKSKGGISEDVLLTKQSPHEVVATMNRAIAFLQEKNVRIFAHISHSEAAQEVGLQMPQEELLIFGNPKIGTDLMLENPAVGIELPLKLIVWQEGDNTIVGWQNMNSLAKNYSLEKTGKVVRAIEELLKNLVTTITLK